MSWQQQCILRHGRTAASSLSRRTRSKKRRLIPDDDNHHHWLRNLSWRPIFSSGATFNNNEAYFSSSSSSSNHSLSDDVDPLLRQKVVIDPRGIPDNLQELVKQYVAKSATQYSLQELMRTGRSEETQLSNGGGSGSTTTSPQQHQSPLQQFRGRLGQRLESERILMQYAGMLQKELPIRLAHRIDDLDHIPGLRDMPSVQAVKRLYLESLEAIVNAPHPAFDRRAEQQFAKLLDSLYRKHSSVLLQMAKGAHEFRSALKQGLIDVKEITTSTATNDDDNNGDDDEEEENASNPWQFSQHDQCQVFLDRFYTSRVGIRVLAGQYLALREQLLQGVGPTSGVPSSPTSGTSSNTTIPIDDYVGMICKRTSPHRIVQAAVKDATRLCLEEYGYAPTVTISGRLDLTFCYIPTHLHYILMELLKNAMKATMDFHIQQHTSGEGEKSVTHQESFESLQSPLSKYQRVQSSDPEGSLPLQPKHVPNPEMIPSVNVIIADSPNNEDVIIKVMDEGGGIPRSQLDRIWSYLFTTAQNNVQETVLELHGQPTDTSSRSPSSNDDDKDSSRRKDVASAAAALAKSPILAGLGFGLPMSRAFARYFGGDLDIISLEGYGTDAYVYVRRLEEGTSYSKSI